MYHPKWPIHMLQMFSLQGETWAKFPVLDAVVLVNAMQFPLQQKTA